MLQTFQQGSPQIPLEFGILLMIIRSLTIFFHIFLQYHILKYEVCNLEKSFFKEERYEVGFRLNVTKLSKAQSVEELWFFLSEPIYLVSKNDWWFFFFIFLWINIFSSDIGLLVGWSKPFIVLCSTESCLTAMSLLYHALVSWL